MHDRPWLRGAFVVGLLATIGYALVASPVGAGPGLTKAKVKSIATQVVKANTGIFSTGIEGPAETPNTLGTIASLSLSAGKYAVFAKGIFLRSTPGTGSVDCELFAGGARVDRAILILGDGSPTDTIPLQATINGGTVELRCTESGIDSTHRNVKITAVRAPA